MTAQYLILQLGFYFVVLSRSRSRWARTWRA